MNQFELMTRPVTFVLALLMIPSAFASGETSIKGPGLSKSSIPKRRKLSGIVISERNLISCVDGILSANRRSNTAQAAAQQLLLAAMDGSGWINDRQKLDASVESCKNFKTLDESATSRNGTLAENKVVHLVQMLISDMPLSCETLRLRAEAAWIFALGVEADYVSCLFQNGKVHNYFGPGITMSMGVGADVSLSRDSDPNTVTPGKYHSTFQADDGKDPIEAGIGIANYFEFDNPGSKRAIVVGASWMEDSSIGAEVRVFNGPRHWDMLIEQLN